MQLPGRGRGGLEKKAQLNREKGSETQGPLVIHKVEMY